MSSEKSEKTSKKTDMDPDEIDWAISFNIDIEDIRADMSKEEVIDFSALKVDEILTWAGNDPERKRVAYDAELAGRARKTLLKKLEQ